MAPRFRRPTQTTTDEGAADAPAQEAAPAGRSARGRGRAAAARPRASRWAGTTAAGNRLPIIPAGRYRGRVEKTEEKTQNGAHYVAELTILESEGADALDVGEQGVFLQGISGKSERPGMARVKAFVMGAGGFEDEHEYDEFDPEGWFIDSTVGSPSPEAQAFADAGDTLIGRIVDFDVTAGNPVEKDGQPVMVRNKRGESVQDYYRNFAWFVVPEEEQEVAAPGMGDD